MIKTSGSISLQLDPDQAIWAKKLINETCLYLYDKQAGKDFSGDRTFLPVIESIVQDLTGTPSYNIHQVGGRIEISNTQNFDNRLASRWADAVYRQFKLTRPFETELRSDPDDFLAAYVKMFDEVVAQMEGFSKRTKVGASFFDRSIFNHSFWSWPRGWVSKIPQAKADAPQAKPATPSENHTQAIPKPTDRVFNHLVADCKPGSLDFWITETSDKMAEKINAAGIEAQIQYLMSQGWTPEQIKKASEQ